MKNLREVILLVALHFIPVLTQDEITPIVQTNDGPIFGLRKSYNGRPYEEYLGVPFAAPPVGSLRWQKPQPVEPWSEPLNATKFSQHCTQFLAYTYPLVGFHAANGEDCLYLNVYVPGSVEENRDARLPVMVWIYGGAFVFGTGEQYPSQDLALHGDVIVVTLNYRLSTLGFLSTGDSEAPGNYGLWDQNAALLWVQKNIETFGGDKGRVTIFGQSAGGASVSHAVASPRNQGLFQNAIAISGASTAFWALAYDPLSTAMLLGDLMDCNALNSQELVACLMNEGPHKLDFWGIVVVTLRSGKVENLIPVIDGDYVPVLPAQAYQSGAGKDVNYITGSTYDDGAAFVIFNMFGISRPGEGVGVAISNATITGYLRLLLGGAENEDELIQAIVAMYPDIYSPDMQTRAEVLSRAVTEWFFGSPTNYEARQHYGSNGSGKTYQYRYYYRNSFLTGRPDWLTATHIDDLYSVFGPPFLESIIAFNQQALSCETVSISPWIRVLRDRYLAHDFEDTDLQVSSKVMDYYTNFAHTGNPNEGPFQPEVEWAEFNSAEQNFLYVSEQFRMSSFYDDNSVDRYRFWTEVFPQMIVFPPKPTFPPAVDTRSVSGQETKKRLSYSEEEIHEAIQKVKLHMKETVADQKMQELLEEKIEEYVKERQEKLSTKTGSK